MGLWVGAEVGLGVGALVGDAVDIALGLEVGARDGPVGAGVTGGVGAGVGYGAGGPHPVPAKPPTGRVFAPADPAGWLGLSSSPARSTQPFKGLQAAMQ